MQLVLHGNVNWSTIENGSTQLYYQIYLRNNVLKILEWITWRTAFVLQKVSTLQLFLQQSYLLCYRFIWTSEIKASLAIASPFCIQHCLYCLRVYLGLTATQCLFLKWKRNISRM